MAFDLGMPYHIWCSVPPSHGGNTGSNPVGDARNYKGLQPTSKPLSRPLSRLAF